MGDDDLIRGPRWRTRTTPGRRRIAVTATAVAIIALGAILMTLVIGLLGRTGAPAWVRSLPWWAPTIIVFAWTVTRATPAVATDDDDDSWTGYVIRYVLAGDGELRPTPVRVVVAVLLGAPIGWSILLFGTLALAGVFEF